MTRNIWIGIVVVIVLIAGGWWYLNQSIVPATSETTQLPTLQEPTNTQTATKPSVPATQTPTSNIQPATNSKPSANEVSFTTPAGYVVRENTSFPESSGIDKRISFIKQEYLNPPSASGEGPASINIDFYRNPQGLTAQKWVETVGVPKGMGYDSTTVSTISFKDGKAGIRFSPPQNWGGMFVENHVAVQDKGWTVIISNFSQGSTDPQNQAFDQLLASITFAK